MRCASGDDGQVLLLSIGLMVLALLLVTVVVSASGVHLERKHLLATADALAAEAADAMPLATYFEGATGRAGSTGAGAATVVLTDRDVRGAVDAYLQDHPRVAEGYLRFEVLEASSPDGRSARVRLGAVVRPTLVSRITALWSDGVTMEVEATARAW